MATRNNLVSTAPLIDVSSMDRRLEKLENSQIDLYKAVQELTVFCTKLDTILETMDTYAPRLRKVEQEVEKTKMLLSTYKWFVGAIFGTGITVTITYFIHKLLGA